MAGIYIGEYPRPKPRTWSTTIAEQRERILQLEQRVRDLEEQLETACALLSARNADAPDASSAHDAGNA